MPPLPFSFLTLPTAFSSLHLSDPLAPQKDTGMEKFGSDLRFVMENYHTDLAVLCDYQISTDFVFHVIEGYFAKDQTSLVSVKNVEVSDGPNMSSVSTKIVISFEAIVLPPWDVEEERKMVIFVKTRAFRGPLELSERLCHKEIAIYEKLFTDMKAFLDHPIKGPYVAPFSEVLFATHTKETPMLVLPSLTEYGYYSPIDRTLERQELKCVLKTLAKFHADGIKFLRENNKDKYPHMKASIRQKRPKHREQFQNFISFFFNFELLEFFPPFPRFIPVCLSNLSFL